MSILFFAFWLVLRTLAVPSPTPQCVPAAMAARAAETNKTTPEGLVFQSKDSGKSWQKTDTGIPDDILFTQAVSFGEGMLLSSDKAAFHGTATDGGMSWESIELPSRAFANFYPNSRRGLLGLTIHGEFYQKTSGGDWQPVLEELKGRTARCYVETGEKSLLVGCVGGILKSDDGGKTWKQTFTQTDIFRIVESTGALLATGPGGMVRSADGGEHWEFSLQKADLIAKTGLFGNHTGIGAMLAAPDGTVKIVVEDGMMASRLLSSSDGGKSWQVAGSLPVSSWSVSLAQAAGGELFASLGSGTYRSADGGKTWEFLFKADSDRVHKLLAVGSSIFAVTMRPGC